jgi:hypothetical protein
MRSSLVLAPLLLVSGCCTSWDVWTLEVETSATLVLPDGSSLEVKGASGTSTNEQNEETYEFGRHVDLRSTAFLYLELDEGDSSQSCHPLLASLVLDTERPIGEVGTVSITGGSIKITCLGEKTTVIEAESTSGWTFAGSLTTDTLHPTYTMPFMKSFESADDGQTFKASGRFELEVERSTGERLQIQGGRFGLVEWVQSQSRCTPVFDIGPG